MSLESITLGQQIFVCSNIHPRDGEGSKLKWFTEKADPASVPSLGRVIASPNILRVFHPAFNPIGPQSKQHRFDYLDKIIFVAEEDYLQNKELHHRIDQIADGLLTLGGLGGDPTCSTGCSCSSCGTPVYRAVFDSNAPHHVRFDRFPDPDALFTIVPAEFVANSPEDTMPCIEFWMAQDTEDDRFRLGLLPEKEADWPNRSDLGDWLLTLPQHAAACNRSKKAAAANPASATRRDRTLRQIKVLAQAQQKGLGFFDTGCCPEK